MSTIRDIAERAGVSTATVSCAINGTKPVKEATRQKILQIARELNYIPNAAARELKAHSTKTIGIILTDIKSKFHSDLFISLSSEFQKNGYLIEVAFSDDQPQIEQQNIERMISKNVDGLVLISCQNGDSPFFRNQLSKLTIPVLFVERNPGGLATNYIGYNNYETGWTLSRSLLRKGYEKIAVFCGPKQYSSEMAFSEGFLEGYSDLNQEDNLLQLYHIDPTKDSAYRQGISCFLQSMPQAVVCTTREITDGLLLAARYLNLEIPKNLCLVSISEESWDTISFESGIHTLSRSSTTLGETIANKMLNLLNSPYTADQLYLEFDDKFDSITQIPPAEEIIPYSNPKLEREDADTLDILIADTPSMRVLRKQSVGFEREYGIKLNFIVYPQDKLLDEIVKRTHKPEVSHDIFGYDAPWLEYLYQNMCMADLKQYTDESGYTLDQCFPELQNNVIVNQKMYGLPVNAGSQILFYRKDLFENHTIQEAYRQEYQLSLRPPRTWTEYNNIARFFTRRFHPDSPVTYGVSISGVVTALDPEILSRIWSYGGSPWDRFGYPSINTPANRNAFLSLRETFQYAHPGSLTCSLTDAVEDFMKGNSAMLVTFTEFASKMGLLNRSSLSRRIGFYHIPGNTTVASGWSFGMNPFTKKRKLVYKYFDWLNRQSTGYFMTVLHGASQLISSYHNHELQSMYPWLSYSEQSIRSSRKRNAPFRKTRLEPHPNEIARILNQAMERILTEGADIDEVLNDAQEEAVRVYTMYGNKGRIFT